MKAFVVDKYKKKGALCLVSMPEPKARDSDVLIRIQASSVNQLDSKVRDGEFKLLLPYRPPFVLGHDVAGTVVRTGPKVRQFKMGDTVYARPRDHRVGTFAEFIVIDEADVALKPKNLDMVEAASVPLVALTAWQALVEVAKVKPGQKVLRVQQVDATLACSLLAGVWNSKVFRGRWLRRSAILSSSDCV